MIENNTNSNFEKTKEFYTPRAIALSAFIGGPLAATYFIAKNFNSLGEQQKAKNTWLIGIIISLAGFAVLSILSGKDIISPIHNLGLLLWVFPSYYFVKFFQKEKIYKQLDKEGKKGSIWKIIGYSLIGTLISVLLIIFVNIAFITLNSANNQNPNLVSAKMEKSGCTVFYDSSKVTYIDAKVVGAYLEQYGIFSKVNSEAEVILNRNNDRYIIQIRIKPEGFSSPKVENIFKQIIQGLDNIYKDRKRKYEFDVIAVESNKIINEKIINLKNG